MAFCWDSKSYWHRWGLLPTFGIFITSTNISSLGNTRLFDESEGWVFVGYMASMKSSQLIFLKPEMRISGRLHRTSSTTPPISGHFQATSSVHTGTVRIIFRWTASWRFLEEYPTTVPRLPQKNEKTKWNLHIKASFTQVSCHLGFYNLNCASIPQKARWYLLPPGYPSLGSSFNFILLMAEIQLTS